MATTNTLPTTIFSEWVDRGMGDLHGAEPTEAPKKRGRGRPKGSPNKTKATPTEEVLVDNRPRGRPKGSKNKTQESPSTQKRCGRCGGIGHNRRTCPCTKC